MRTLFVVVVVTAYASFRLRKNSTTAWTQSTSAEIHKAACLVPRTTTKRAEVEKATVLVAKKPATAKARTIRRKRNGCSTKLAAKWWRKASPTCCRCVHGFKHAFYSGVHGARSICQSNRNHFHVFCSSPVSRLRSVSRCWTRRERSLKQKSKSNSLKRKGLSSWCESLLGDSIVVFIHQCDVLFWCYC